MMFQDPKLGYKLHHQVIGISPVVGHQRLSFQGILLITLLTYLEVLHGCIYLLVGVQGVYEPRLLCLKEPQFQYQVLLQLFFLLVDSILHPSHILP